jgi:hypothetical protein
MNSLYALFSGLTVSDLVSMRLFLDFVVQRRYMLISLSFLVSRLMHKAITLRSYADNK